MSFWSGPLVTPFDTIEFQSGSLLLRYCYCAGTQKHYLPRSHIDHVSYGRRLPLLFLLVVTVAFVGAIVGSKGRTNGNDTVVQAVCASVLGIIYLLVFLLCDSFRIVTNNGVFEAMGCSHAMTAEEVMRWLDQPQPAPAPAVISVPPGLAMLPPSRFPAASVVPYSPPPLPSQAQWSPPPPLAQQASLPGAPQTASSPQLPSAPQMAPLLHSLPAHDSSSPSWANSSSVELRAMSRAAGAAKS